MADFISGYPGADAERVGALGICGGGGYTLKAAQSDKRFTAVATVSMFNSGRVRREGLQDSQRDTIQARLQQATAARAQEKAGGEILHAGDADLTDEQIAAQPFGLYRQGYVYYWKTHAHPNSTFKYTMSSLMDLMSFDVTDQIELIDKPLLMIAGSKADTRYMTEEAFPKATGTEDKCGASRPAGLGAGFAICLSWQEFDPVVPATERASQNWLWGATRAVRAGGLRLRAFPSHRRAVIAAAGAAGALQLADGDQSIGVFYGLCLTGG